MFCDFDHEVVFLLLSEMAEEQCTDYLVSPDKYSMKLNFVKKSEDVQDNEEIKMKVRFLRINKDKFCIDVLRSKGNVYAFKEYFDKMKSYLDDFVYQ